MAPTPPITEAQRKTPNRRRGALGETRLGHWARVSRGMDLNPLHEWLAVPFIQVDIPDYEGATPLARIVLSMGNTYRLDQDPAYHRWSDAALEPLAAASASPFDYYARLEWNQRRAVDLLLQAGADPNSHLHNRRQSPSEPSLTLLYWARSHHWLRERLLAAGADPNPAQALSTPLLGVLEDKRMDDVHWWLAHGAKGYAPQAPWNLWHRVLYARSVQRRQASGESTVSLSPRMPPEAVEVCWQFLLNQREGMDACANERSSIPLPRHTPLQSACQAGDWATVRTLLHAGASPLAAEDPAEAPVVLWWNQARTRAARIRGLRLLRPWLDAGHPLPQKLSGRLLHGVLPDLVSSNAMERSDAAWVLRRLAKAGAQLQDIPTSDSPLARVFEGLRLYRRDRREGTTTQVVQWMERAWNTLGRLFPDAELELLHSPTKAWGIQAFYDHYCYHSTVTMTPKRHATATALLDWLLSKGAALTTPCPRKPLVGWNAPMPTTLMGNLLDVHGYRQTRLPGAYVSNLPVPLFHVLLAAGANPDCLDEAPERPGRGLASLWSRGVAEGTWELVDALVRHKPEALGCAKTERGKLVVLEMAEHPEGWALCQQWVQQGWLNWHAEQADGTSLAQHLAPVVASRLVHEQLSAHVPEAAVVRRRHRL